MEFKMITVDEFNKEHGKNWESPKSKYQGEIPGYYIGVTPEVVLKDGTLDTESTTFICSVDELNDGFWTYHRADMEHRYKWTGRLVFRGYYSAYYDSEEREDYYMEEDFSEDKIIEWDDEVFDDKYDDGE